MSDSDETGCACASRRPTEELAGPALYSAVQSPSAPVTYRSPWATPSPPAMACPVDAPDVSFLFRSCLQPERGLGESAFGTAAQALGVEVAVIKAVAQVESRESAFDETGRPTILYERHYFSRLTGGRYDVTDPDISGPRYGAGQYGRLSQQYKRLEHAHALDPWAALQSVSWGRFQVMGEHHILFGYASPQHMALAFSRTEQSHLDAFVAYVRADTRCTQALRDKAWAAFARCYNGSDYAAYKYDEKMAAAYAKLMPPTTAKPGAAPGARADPKGAPR